jgi:hypothetical protein
MDDAAFPANSRNPRRQEEKEDKKLEKVVTGPVARRKPSLGRRIREMFVGGDAQSVGGYVLIDILIPAVKDTLADMVSQGIERMLFGEARSTSRRTGYRPGGSSGYVAYQRYSSSRSQERREDPRPRLRSKGSHNFDDIILATRVEAEQVIDRMFDLLAKYEQVAISDLYEMVGITPQYTDERWGWTELRGAGVQRTMNGYLLDLPRPDPLD